MNETVAGTAVVNLALNDAHLQQGQLLGIGSFFSLPERASARPYADAGYASGVWRQAVREALADVSRIGGGVMAIGPIRTGKKHLLS